MKSFYSLIKISLNELSGDNLTIGMILSSPNGFMFKFSKNKKNFAKSLLSLDSKVLELIEREISKTLKEENQKLSLNNNELFELPSIFNSDYFSYLSKYSNGVLKFSEPNLVAKNVDKLGFEKLFTIFVDSTEQTKTESPKKAIEKVFFDKVNKNLITKVKGKVNTNHILDNNVVPSLFNPFHIDCIGRNGSFIAAKSLPFSQSKDTLHKNINTYISVIAQLSLDYAKVKNENKFYLIADEPLKGSEEHVLWKHIYKNERVVKVISSDDSGEIADIIISNNAKPFLTLSN